ncbi:NUDIX hydrolase [Paucibacter sp. Y2R2-4]|uniref:NUDIX hydrolase n=1 Tax=Paucibacter sp. Y2R2-4 TaxID=2893553 RepID=UPI0021E3A201|nr:NUDIX hydrolase [Paucibacter sp. Y2R2-4]MCV2350436.1 NUDIX hydrolase [Paucibacter sp. Y2R2-4]
MSTPSLRAQAQQILTVYLARAFPDESARLQALSQQLAEDAQDPFCRSNLRGHITTSAVVLDPAAQQLLLIHHKTLDRWLQPGGHFEPNQAADPLLASAQREASEETGVSQLLPHPEWRDPVSGLALPFDIDSHPIPANPRKQEGPHWHHDYAYLLLADAAQSLSPQIAEVHAAAWLPLAELAQLPDQRMRLLGEKLSRLGLTTAP